MANFADCILVKIAPSEPDFIVLTTFDIYHGKSGRFLLRNSDMETLLSGNQPSLLDTDIGSYIHVTRDRMKLHFRLTWLHQDFKNDVAGYIQYFELPVEKVRSVLNGRRIHHVEYSNDEKPKAKLIFTDGGYRMLHKYCQDKLTKHALRRFFRDHLNYGQDERVVIYPDGLVKGFYFQCDRMEGGIAQHEDVLIGKDGREHKKIFYAVHT